MSVERKKILLEASGCHVHLTEEAVAALFGKGAVLKKRRDLSQPGEFLSEQRVKLVTKDGSIENVAVLGPARSAVQVELSATDCRKLGLKAPVNLSGNLEGASDVMMIGTVGELKANGSVIVARNHIHMRPQDAYEYGVTDGQCVRVEVESDRKVIFENVPIRVSEKFAPAMHIDFDEANACGYRVGTEAFILMDTCREVPCQEQWIVGQQNMNEQNLEQLVNEIVRQVCAIVEQGKIVSCQSREAADICGQNATDACGQIGSGQSANCDGQQPTGGNSTAACEPEVIHEKLVTEKVAKTYLENCGCDTLRFAKGTIITPAAKDIFKAGHKNIEIV